MIAGARAGHAGRDHQEAARKVFAVFVAHRVDSLPRDEHRHHGGFARAGRQLERKAHQFGIGIAIGVLQVFENAASGFRVRSDFVEPDGGFDGFDLTEKRAHALKIVVPPMREVGSYCCCEVERCLPSSKTSVCCIVAPLRFLGLGIGVMNLASRRSAIIFCVG